VGSKTPTAGCHGKTWAGVAKWIEEGGCVVDGRQGGARWCSLSADGAGQDGLVHAAQGATHGVGPCCRALMVFSWAGTCCTGMVVVHVAAMRDAVVPVVKTLDWRGGLDTWVLVVDVAGAVADAVCDAATVVAAAAAVPVLIATVVAAAPTVCVLVATTIVSAAAVPAAATVISTALLSTAASATWALLVVDDTGRGRVISDGLAEHLELPLDRHDVGRVGSECFLGGGVSRAKVGNRIREGCRCVVVGRHHAVAVLTRRDGGKCCYLDCILPECFERGEVNRVVGIVASQDPRLYSLAKSPVQLRTRMPMSTVSLSVIG
jgi:hypothetical protein